MIALAAGALILAAPPVAGIRPLPHPGVVAGSELRPGETHIYEALLARGDFVSFTVNQRGVDVLVTCRGPDGRALAEHDGPYQRFGPEVVVLLAAAAGTYRVEVRGQEEHAIPGRYVLTVTEWRPARPDDERRTAAQKAYEEGCVLDKQTSRSSRAAALTKYQEALAAWKDLRDPFQQATTLILMGDVHRDLSEHRLAIQEYEEALALVRGLKDRGAEAKILRKTGTLLRVVGETPRGIAMMESAARIAREVGDPQTEVSTLRSLSWAWLSLGDYQKALETGLEGLANARSIRDRVHEASAVDGVAKTYEALGDHEQAILFGQKALDLARSVKSQTEILSALRGLGLSYLSAGRPEKARAYFVETLQIAETLGDRRRRATALNSVGDVDLELENAPSAHESYAAALATAERVDFPGAAADALFGLGRAHAKRGDAEAALAHLNRALDAYRRVGDREGEQRALTEIGRVEAGRGRLSEARAAVDAAIALVESSAIRLRNPEVRVYYSASTQRLYALGVDVLLKLHEREPSAGLDVKAFEMSERGRARTLLEAVAAAQVKAPASEPLTLDAIQRASPDGVVIVSYAFTGGGLVAFVVGRDTFRTVRLEPGARALADAVGNYRDLLARGDAAASDVASALFRDLIAPWRGLVGKGTRHLVVLPDGPLHEMPFDALPIPGTNGRLLVEDVLISYAPSASVLAHLAAPRAVDKAPRPDALILADPARSGAASPAMRVYEEEGFRDTPIPFSRREAERIARYANSSSVLLLGADARKRRVVAEDLSRFRVLHFAMHAFTSRRAPAHSALILATEAATGDAGFLSAGEIYRFRLDADLVVLSGCQTARGQVLPGEGVQGLVSAFLHAGARSVVASLWNVDDESTAGLMESFYRGLNRGLGKGEALREARLELLRRGAAPRLWAPFVLIGEAAAPVPLER